MTIVSVFWSHAVILSNSSFCSNVTSMVLKVLSDLMVMTSPSWVWQLRPFSSEPHSHRAPLCNLLIVAFVSTSKEVAHTAAFVSVCVLAKLFSCGLYTSCSCGTCSGGKNSHFLLCASSSNYILATQTLAGVVIAQHVNSSSYIALATCQRKQRPFND